MHRPVRAAWVAVAVALALLGAACDVEHLSDVAADRQIRVPLAPITTSIVGSPAASPIPSRTASVPPNVYANDGLGDFSPAVAGIPERVYVPNTLSGTVSVIDPKTYRVVATLRVGGEPHHVTPSWDLRHLYVDNPGNDTLGVIDPRSAKLVGSIAAPSPYNLYFTPDGTKAIVVAEYDQEIQFRNPKTWTVIRTVRIPGSGVDHMDFSADGRFLLVSDEYSGLVVRVSTTEMAATGTIHVGGRPVDVRVSPDGSVFFVANQGLGGVSVIDPQRMRQIAFLHTGVGAHGMAVSRSGALLYVSNRIGGTISAISFRTRTVVATWRVGGSPDMLQVSPDGKELWASNRFSDTVSVISTVTGRVRHTILVGFQPHGLSYFPEPGLHSIGHNGVYR